MADETAYGRVFLMKRGLATFRVDVWVKDGLPVADAECLRVAEDMLACKCGRPGWQAPDWLHSVTMADADSSSHRQMRTG